MEIKDRTIQMGNNHSSMDGDCIVIDEYGIEDGKMYHRNIVINQKLYDDFEKDPDSDMLLDEFLTHHDIRSEWELYELKIPKRDNLENELKDSYRLFDDIDIKSIQNGTAELDEQTKNEIYQKVYDALAEKETLISNPYIMDVFNEAIREDPEMANWESVFPFFR